MKIKANLINKRSGVTLVELILTIVIVSVVCIAAASSIVYVKEVSYKNKTFTQMSTLAYRVSEEILATVGETFNDSESDIEQAKTYLDEYYFTSVSGGVHLNYKNYDDYDGKFYIQKVSIKDEQYVQEDKDNNTQKIVNYLIVTFKISDNTSFSNEGKYSMAMDKTVYIPLNNAEIEALDEKNEG